MKVYFPFILSLLGMALVEGAVIAKFNDKGKYDLITTPLETQPLATSPIYSVIASGDQGLGKSTLENALNKAMGIEDELFFTHKKAEHCTKDIQISKPSSKGVVMGDRPGANKAGVSKETDSAHVDLMTAQMTAPFANIILQVCDKTLKESDLQSMLLYGDERLHTGKLSLTHHKPELLIVLKALEAPWLRDDRPSTEQEYLEFSIPKDSPLRKTFNSITLVYMPEITGPDKALLSYENFHPDRVPLYWAVVQRLASIVEDMAAKMPDSARLTGSDLSVLLQKLLPAVNANADIDIPTMRTAVLLNKVKAEIGKRKSALAKQFAPHIANPYQADLVNKLTTTLASSRSDTESALLDQFRDHQDEAALWRQVQATVRNELDAIIADIDNQVAHSKNTVLNREQNAYESARVTMSTARSNMKLDGASATVDHELVSALRAPIQAFQDAAVLPSVAPSPSCKTKLDRLKDDAVALWGSAHDANYAVYNTKREELKNVPIAEVKERINHRIHSCSNTHHDRTFNLGQMYPQYFGPAVKGNLYSVRSSFEGSGNGSGNFNLGQGVSEHQVSEGGVGGKKWNGNRIYYNPQNTVLRVWLAGSGWGGGVCSNSLDMHSVDLSIVRNALALSENTVYNQPYQRAPTPVL